MSDNRPEDFIDEAMKYGCDAAEIFMKNSREISVESKDGNVEALEASQGFGIGLRVIKGSKLGFSYTTDPDDVKDTVKRAFEGAEWTEEDKFIDIPEHMEPVNVSIFDEELASVRDEEVIKDAIYLEEITRSYDSRITKVRKAETTAGTGSTTIINSRGVNISYQSSYYAASVSALAEGENNDNQMGWNYGASRKRTDIDLKSIGEVASERAIELLGSRKISPVKVPIIFIPSVAVDFLDILSASLSADAVQKKRSFLAGKTGEKIVSPLVNIYDDGTRPWGIATRPVDDEGVTTQNKRLIADGTLQGYIHNTYTAKKDGLTSTGNAVRSGTATIPGVGVTNFYLESDKEKPEDNLIKSLAKGIVIVGAMGVHTANPISGDFSVGISGLWVEKGEVLYPVKEAVLSGNILDMFKKVEAVGGDLNFYGRAGSPSILIGDMDISA